MLLAALAVLAGAALADTATVTHRLASCDWFLAESDEGFIVLEWYGGNEPEEGDVLFGDFSVYGFADVYNVTAESEVYLWLDDYMLDEEAALQQLVDDCE